MRPEGKQLSTDTKLRILLMILIKKNICYNTEDLFHNKFIQQIKYDI